MKREFKQNYCTQDEYIFVYGKQTVCFILEHASVLIEEVYFSKEIDKRLFHKFLSLQKPILRLDNKKAQALSRGGNHQGFLLKMRPPVATDISILKELNSLVVLCGVSDVGNIGSIARTAYALGVDGLILCQVDSLNLAGVLRSSVGALLGLPFCVFKNPLDLLTVLKSAGFVCIGADSRGRDLSEIGDRDKWALFLGSESEGLSSKILRKVDTMVGIQMMGGFDSLNVGVAGGILMHSLKGRK